MTAEEYDQELDLIKEAMLRAQQNLDVKYIRANARAKIGNVVTDHRCSIVVERIEVGHLGWNVYPEAIYHGRRLTKNGNVYKNGATDTIYNRNIKSVREGWK
jgi:hypothetical protein